jgi:DNA-binding IscR family transcriptional regulator
VIRQALGGWHTKLFDLEPIKAAAKEQGISDETLIESLHALGDGHYLNVTFGPADNVFEFELTRFGYETGIGAVIPDVERIRRQVISALVNEPPTGESVVEELAKQFDAPILVVEQILESLREQNLISRIRTLGGDSVTRVSPTLRRRIL